MLCEKRETRNEKCARLRSPEPRPALKPETRNEKRKRGGLGISERLWETRSRKREMRNEKRAICSPGFCPRLKRETRNVKSEASQILGSGRKGNFVSRGARRTCARVLLPGTGPMVGGAGAAQGRALRSLVVRFPLMCTPKVSWLMYPQGSVCYVKGS